MVFQHKTLAEGGWQTLSLAEQMGNIGSETGRILRWKDKDEKLFQSSFERALELLYLTIQDPRWCHRLKELTRVREFLIDAVSGGNSYGSRLEDLDRYFFQFALAARRNK